MLKHLHGYFFTGLLIMLPVLITIELLIWTFKKVDSILGDVFKQFQIYIPGLGLISLLFLILLVGIAGRNYLGKKLISFGEQIFKRIPVLKGIYGTTKQITESLTKSERSASWKVVMVEYPRKGIYSPGFLTGDSPVEASQKDGKKLLSIFIPTVPNPTTGFLIFVPEEEVRYLNITVEEGIKLIISAGVLKPG